MDRESEQAIIAVTFQNVGSGLRIAQEICRELQPEILEAAPMSPGRYFLLAKIASEKAESAESQLREKGDILYSAVIRDPEDRLLEAYYHLQSPADFKTLLVLEGPSLPEILHQTNTALKHGATSVLEIQNGRGLAGYNLAVLGFEKTVEWRDVKAVHTRAEWILSIDDRWKSYYA